jgi:prepilin-type processing-associated H-X9-DG protein
MAALFPLLVSSPVNITTSGNHTIVAATTAKLTTVYKLFLVANGNVNVTFYDGSTALSGPLALMADGSIILNFDNNPWFTGSVNSNFIIATDEAVTVGGAIYYTLLVPYTLPN